VMRRGVVALVALLSALLHVDAALRAYVAQSSHLRVRSADLRPAARPLWTFWNTPTQPDFIRLCMSTLKRRAGRAWDLHVVTPMSVRQYVSSEDLPQAFDRLSPSFQADAVRLALLRRHGGAWIDATAIPARDLSEWIDPQFDAGRHFVGFFIAHFTKAGGAPLVASWAMAVPSAEERVMTAWHEAYLRLWRNRTSADAITEDPFFAGADLCCVNPLVRDYLHIELILLTLLQRDSDLSQEFVRDSVLWRAEDTAYSVQAHLGLPWMASNKCAPVTAPIASLPVDLQAALKATPLVKLRHEDREWLMRMPSATLLRCPASLIGSVLVPSTGPAGAVGDAGGSACRADSGDLGCPREGESAGLGEE